MSEIANGTSAPYGVNSFMNIQQSVDSIQLPSVSLTSQEKRSATVMEKVLRQNSVTYGSRLREQKNREMFLQRNKIRNVNSMSNMATQRLRLLNSTTSAHSKTRRDFGTPGNEQQRLSTQIIRGVNQESLLLLNIRPKTSHHHMAFQDRRTLRQGPPHVSSGTPQPVRMSRTKLRSSMKKGSYLSMSPASSYQNQPYTHTRIAMAASALTPGYITTNAPCNSPCHTPDPSPWRDTGRAGTIDLSPEPQNPKQQKIFTRRLINQRTFPLQRSGDLRTFTSQLPVSDQTSIVIPTIM